MWLRFRGAGRRRSTKCSRLRPPEHLERRDLFAMLAPSAASAELGAPRLQAIDRPEPVFTGEQHVIPQTSARAFGAAFGKPTEVFVGSYVNVFEPQGLGNNLSANWLGENLRPTVPPVVLDEAIVDNGLGRLPVAASLGGHSVVVYTRDHGAFQHETYAQFFSAPGVKARPPVRVNQNPFGIQLAGSVGMADDGTTVVVWASQGQDAGGSGVYARRFTGEGRPLGDEFPVPADGSADQRMPSVAVAPGGSFIVVWVQLRSGTGQDIFARRFDRTGQPLGVEFLVSTDSQGDQYNPQVGVDETGRFIVAWNTRGLQTHTTSIRRFDSNGNALGDQFAPSQILSANNEVLYSLAVHRDGRWAVSWTSGTVTTHLFVWMRYYWPDGSASAAVELSSTVLGNAVVLDQRGLPVLIRSSDTSGSNSVLELKAQRFAFRGDANADGTVGVADYLVWAAQYGQSGNRLAGDLDFDHQVGAADYTVWAALAPAVPQASFVDQRRASSNRLPTSADLVDRLFAGESDQSDGNVRGKGSVTRGRQSHDRDGKHLARQVDAFQLRALNSPWWPARSYG